MKVILIVIVVMTGNGRVEREYPMPDMKTCLDAVKSARVQVSNGEDNEQSAIVVCAHKG